jgi:hypothetical protein
VAHNVAVKKVIFHPAQTIEREWMSFWWCSAAANPPMINFLLSRDIGTS